MTELRARDDMNKLAVALSMIAVVAVGFAQPVSAGALASAVIDPTGDATLVSGIVGRPFQDIVGAEISKKGATFVLTMKMAGLIPEIPESAPLKVALLEWRWGLDTDPTTSPAGFPVAPGFALPAEYQVQILWDGTRFSGQLINRTPLLTGGEAIVTPLSFSIKGAEFKTSVTAAMIGDPSSFSWFALAVDWLGPLGTGAFFAIDIAPNIGPATWPS